MKKYSVQKGFDNWIVDAAACDHWMLMKRDFLPFTYCNTMDDRFFCIRLRPEGVALDPASFDLT